MSSVALLWHDGALLYASLWVLRLFHSVCVLLEQFPTKQKKKLEPQRTSRLRTRHTASGRAVTRPSRQSPASTSSSNVLTVSSVDGNGLPCPPACKRHMDLGDPSFSGR